jgi:hypothetical protein
MSNIRVVPVELSDKTVVQVSVVVVDKEETVALRQFAFADAVESLRSLLSDFASAFSKLSCDRVTLEVGIQFSVKGGKLVSLLVDGSGSASAKVRVEFGSNATG